jgi:iron complex outermembrane receptor protein
MRVVLRGDVTYKGKQYWDPENSMPRDGITLVNLRAGLEDAKGKWNVALSVNNATNKLYNSEWVGGGFSAPGTPRVVRLDARYNF